MKQWAAFAVLSLSLGACGMVNLNVVTPPGRGAGAQQKLQERYGANDGYQPLRDLNEFIDRGREAALGGSPMVKTKVCGSVRGGSGRQSQVMPKLQADLLNESTTRHYIWVDDRFVYFSVPQSEAAEFDKATDRGGTVCLWSDGEMKTIKRNMAETGTGVDLVSLFPVTKWDSGKAEDDAAAPAAAPADAAPSPAPETQAASN